MIFAIPEYQAIFIRKVIFFFFYPVKSSCEKKEEPCQENYHVQPVVRLFLE